MGEAEKQRAPEPPVFTHLSLARASMKIWCIFKSDTAIKWRELLVVEEPAPLACVAHNIFGESPGVVYLLDMSNKVWFKSHQVVHDIGG